MYVYLESTTATLWVPQYCRSVHEETHRITMSNLSYATQLNFKGISVTQSRLTCNSYAQCEEDCLQSRTDKFKLVWWVSGNTGDKRKPGVWWQCLTELFQPNEKQQSQIHWLLEQLKRDFCIAETIKQTIMNCVMLCLFCM